MAGVPHPIAVARFHVYINLPLQISDETRVSVDQKLEMKAKDTLLLVLWKIIAKGEVVGK